MKDLINKVERMTSIEIAEVTGKQHKNVMQAIRNMEPAWEKVNGRKFALVEYHQSAWEKVSGLKFQLKQRTISQHGRKYLG